MSRYRVLSVVVRALLAGGVLQTREVTAGRGLVVHWGTVKCGETVMSEGSPYDVADLFVCLVGPLAAVRAARRFLRPF